MKHLPGHQNLVADSLSPLDTWPAEALRELKVLLNRMNSEAAHNDDLLSDKSAVDKQVTRWHTPISFKLVDGHQSKDKEMSKNLKNTVPRYRNGLKARMILAGYRTAQEFAKATSINSADISRTMTGKLTPELDKQERMAETLGLTLDAFARLL